jgi:predicted dienelactone hydrolase
MATTRPAATPRRVERTRPKIGDRVADLVLVLDRLADLPKSVPALNGKIDPTSIGVGGHSFGAYTAMLIGGVAADLGKEKGNVSSTTSV